MASSASIAAPILAVLAIVRRFFRISLLEVFGLTSLICIATAGTLQGSDTVADWFRFSVTVLVLIVCGLACGSSGKTRSLHAAFVAGATLYHLFLASTVFTVAYDIGRILWDVFGDAPDDSSETLRFLTYAEMTAQAALTIVAGWLCRRVAYAIQEDAK